MSTKEKKRNPLADLWKEIKKDKVKSIYIFLSSLGLIIIVFIPEIVPTLLQTYLEPNRRITQVVYSIFWLSVWGALTLQLKASQKALCTMDRYKQLIRDFIQNCPEFPRSGEGEGIDDNIYDIISTKIENSDIEPSPVEFISPYGENIINQDIRQILRLTDEHNEKLNSIHWYIITNFNEQRENIRRNIQELLANSDKVKIFLIDELPMFRKILFINNTVMWGCLGNKWVLWKPENINSINISGYLPLTLFDSKLDYFLSREEMHKAISVYHATIIRNKGFIVGGRNPYPPLPIRPEEMLSRIKTFQDEMNKGFREISRNLIKDAKKIIANLPLIGNYEMVVGDNIFGRETYEWLNSLCEWSKCNKEIKIIRFLYAAGEEQGDGQYYPSIDYYRDKIKELIKFVTGTHFSERNKERYEIYVIYVAENRDDFQRVDPHYGFDKYLSDAYNESEKKYRNIMIDIRELKYEIVSNWIWFECQDYHVLQTEMKWKVDDNLKKSIAEYLADREWEILNRRNENIEIDRDILKTRYERDFLDEISIYKFCDININDIDNNDIKKLKGNRYELPDYKVYRKYCLELEQLIGELRKYPFIEELDSFINKLNKLNTKITNPTG